ncbi:MAG TPA: nitronate monooxygenase [Gaiellaceae bacterium]|nr:nitronate monooxygenase [Gaiellaceae bacterium]
MWHRASIRTRLTELLGIEHPVIQAPMGTAAGPALASAVSEAGGLGTISVSFSRPGAIGSMVDAVRAETDRPFAANVLLEWPPEERLSALLEAGVSAVSLAWGDPAPWVETIHAAGALVLTTVGSAEEARRAEAVGVDVVVAQGFEAGGHVWGEVGTFVLVPAVRDAVSLPVVAAGGIADGRGLAAALALGADGVWIGTRFLLAEEAPLHPVFRELLAGAAETDTFHAHDLFHLGWEDAPHRALRNSTYRMWADAGYPRIGQRPREGEDVATRGDGTPIRRYSSSLPVEGMDGNIEALSLYAGQSVGLVDRVEPAAAIVSGIVAEADALLAKLGRPAST